MVLMAKKSEGNSEENKPEIDCRRCLHYPKPNTTGKNEDLATATC